MTYHNTPSNLRSSTPLSMEQLRTMAPSIFADAPHSSRSEKFAFVSSVPVVEGMMKAGFLPMVARQSRAMTQEKRETTKHMLRFRHPSAPAMREVGDVVPEIVMVNANDGSSSYQLMAGLFRLACLNGMIVPAGSIANLRVNHSGNQERVVAKVIEGAYAVIDESVKALEAPKAWSQIPLNRDEQVAFAESAHILRFADSAGNVTTPVRPDQLLSTRRLADSSRDLWTTFNVVQENVIRGGIHAVGRDANNRIRRVTSRAVTGIDTDVKLNKALWQLAERMAQIKA